MKRVWLAILAIGLFAVAAVIHPSLSPMTVTAQQPPAQTSPVPDAEVAALRAQLEEMRRSEDRIIETVYWALGGVFGIAVLLVGFNLFGGLRAYQRDKDAMRQELQGTLNQEIGLIRTDLTGVIQRDITENDKRLNEFEQRTQTQIAEQYQRFTESAQAGWETALKPLRAEILDTRRELDRSFQSFTQDFSGKLERIEEQLRNNQYELLDLTYKVHEIKAERGSQATTSIKLIQLAIKMEKDYRLDGLLRSSLTQ